MAIPSSNLAGNKETILDMNILDQVVGSGESLSAIYSFEIFQEGSLVSTFESEPVTLTFKVDPSKVDEPENVKIYYYNESNEEWELIGGNYEGGYVSTTVDHFSIYAAFNSNDMLQDVEETDAPKEESVTEGNESSEETESEEEGSTEESTNNIVAEGSEEPQEESMTGDKDHSEESELEEESSTDETREDLANLDDEEINVATEDEKEEANETDLPDTTTSMYNWLLVGAILLIFGSILVFKKRRELRQ